MKTNRRENQVSAGVHAYLETRKDLFFFRSNVSAGMAPSGKFIRSGAPGQGDYLALQAPSGRFVTIEVKREKDGKVSDDQWRFMSNVVAHGGLAIVATDVETLAKALGPVRAHVVKFVKPRVIHR